MTEAAQGAHISAGFLSAIELSHANPSVGTIYRLAAAYGTTVLELYDVVSQSNRVIRPRNRKSLETKSGVRMKLPRLINHEGMRTVSHVLALI